MIASSIDSSPIQHRKQHPRPILSRCIKRDTADRTDGRTDGRPAPRAPRAPRDYESLIGRSGSSGDTRPVRARVDPFSTYPLPLPILPARARMAWIRRHADRSLGSDAASGRDRWAAVTYRYVERVTRAPTSRRDDDGGSGRREGRRCTSLRRLAR
jgi:hypothetical protein